MVTPVALYLQDAHPIREAMGYAQRAEALGFAAVWQADSRLVREATVPMAAFAATTERVGIGSGVIDVWSRNPARLASLFSTLDDLAPGRVLAGLGAWWDPLAAKVGIDRARPLLVMREVLEAIRALLRCDGPVTVDGHYVHLDEPLPGTVLHNPRSNLNNAVGYARPARFERVALGTDGIGASMLDEFALAYVLHRSDDVTATPDTAWGWLDAGLAIVPEAATDEVTWAGADRADPWYLAFTTGVRAERVVVDGEVVVDEGTVTKVDGERIRARAWEEATRLWKHL